MLSAVIPIAEPLRRKLDTAMRTARSVDQTFLTPHLLLELIRHGVANLSSLRIHAARTGKGNRR